MPGVRIATATPGITDERCGSMGEDANAAPSLLPRPSLPGWAQRDRRRGLVVRGGVGPLARAEERRDDAVQCAQFLLGAVGALKQVAQIAGDAGALLGGAQKGPHHDLQFAQPV